MKIKTRAKTSSQEVRRHKNQGGGKWKRENQFRKIEETEEWKVMETKAWDPIKERGGISY